MTARRASSALVIVAIALAACTSPEATRTRASGPGGDIGNRKANVEMHEGSRPYFNTPQRISKSVGMAETEVSALPGGAAR